MPVLSVGGWCRFSTVDWPGQLCAVIFLQGCPWRCGYCHNPSLQTRAAPAVDWAAVLDWLPTRRGLLDGVVFSGGEPLLDAHLPEALSQVRSLGFATGLHTAGIYPERLRKVLPLLNWVGLDIKAALDPHGRYGRITGATEAWRSVSQCLDWVLQAHRTFGLDYECRTTWHPDWLDHDELHRLAQQLQARSVKHWVLQEARATPKGLPSNVSPVSLALLRQTLQRGLPRVLPSVQFRATALVDMTQAPGAN